MLKLEFPNESHREMYEAVIQELDSQGIDFLHPADAFTYRSGNYNELIQRSKLISEGKIEGFVPADLYFAISDNKIIGAISIRHHINHPNLIHRGGHIGYGIRPSERRKGYATEMLKMGIDKVKEMSLQKVLITCDVNNIGSRKVIENNGGILETEAKDENGNSFFRYWITL